MKQPSPTPAVGWSSIRLKFVADLVNQKAEGVAATRPYVGLENIESQSGRLVANAQPAEPDGTANVFDTRHVLFGKLRPYLAKALRPDFDGRCTSELLVLDPRRADRDFLFWFCLSDWFLKTVDSSTYGAKMPRASWDFIGNLLIAVPARDQQRAIVEFLDAKTAAIDALIAKKERLIELLEEKRQAVITRTIKNGISADAPLRESGIGWLGAIPAHWSLKRLKHLSGRISGRLVYSPAQYLTDEGVPFLFAFNVTEDGISLDNAKYISPETNRAFASHALHEGDLVTVRVGDPGVTAVVPSQLDGCNCASVMIIRQHPRFDSRWLCYAMNSVVGRIQVDLVNYGAAQRQFNITDAVDFLFPVPPLPEQAQIADYLDRRVEQIRTVRRRLAVAIGRLSEYRQALISAAVTGQIDDHAPHAEVTV